jgi:predicted PurR-regulated permease PerM
MTSERNEEFGTPRWLRDLGFTAWMLVGIVLIVVGVLWILGVTATITTPVLVAGVLGVVTGPIVGWLEKHGIPRIFGAIIVMLGIAVLGLIVFLLVFGGISQNSASISKKLNAAADTIQGWLKDLGIDKKDVTNDVKKDLPQIRTALMSGIAGGIKGLSSLVFFIAFSVLSTLFILKDGPVMHRFINRHMGVPEPTANVVTTNVAKSLRSYFLGVTLIAAFNAVLLGGAALIIGVPLAGTIAVVTFVGAYIPFVGAWVAGAFAVLIALGTDGESAAIVMAIVGLLANGILQQMIQPFVMGATLGLNPLAVLIVTIGGGALFGMAGLTLAAPLTSAAVHISSELRGRADEEARAGPAPAPSG